MMSFIIPIVVLTALAVPQSREVKYSDPAAGVEFTYPSSYQITEQSRDYSQCSWFVTLRSGDSEIRLNFTGNSFGEVAESENFESNGTHWTFFGKQARVVTRSSYRSVEADLTDDRGRPRSATVAFLERHGKCSAVLVTPSSGARAVLYAIADSFRFTR